MTTHLLDWDWDDTDLQPDSAEEYAALMNGLRRSRGFGLYFVQCSPFSATKLTEQLQADLSALAVLKLERPLPQGNLYRQVKQALADQGNPPVLVIMGLEHSLADAAETKPRLGWSPEEIKTESWTNVPPVLIHLNQQREQFRDGLQTCLVFVLPQYALDYVAARSPDFFDWRSGKFNYASDAATLAQESKRILADADYDAYCGWSEDERKARLFAIQPLVEESKTSPEMRARLYFEQGNLFAASNDHEGALASFERALAINPDDHQALYNKGNALSALGRKEDAIACYDAALKIKPDFHQALNNKGNTLYALGRKEDAIACYDAALVINPDLHQALYNKGNALDDLGRKNEAVCCYNAALKIKPDNLYALNRKGWIFCEFGRYEEAIDCFDTALNIKPGDDNTLNQKGWVLYELNRYENAIEYYDAALAIETSFATLYNKYLALYSLGRDEEAAECYRAALAINPDLHKELYATARSYALSKNLKNAVLFLKAAIELNPKYQTMAQTDTDFDPLRTDSRFQALIHPTA